MLFLVAIVANFRELRECQADNCASSRTTETGRTSTIWMATKSMTSESGLFFKDEAAADRKLAELARQQKKDWQEGLDVPAG
jgi:hypothetical protein